ncbi:T9SS-dependent choice-of-anchor J family protein [Flavobacterium caeni]|uniref:Por secretion system C-terminal sorting domain-containing protein n=1 Tax=Flavobacterium caeni TaxID=490189 RepID=A0A1G5CY05_9FLAO|nr:T9SS type A sorting domain-containing protein [Flavobacterium caeni]SCY07286.1 Por secretion system C-terminal sorting domain-containing protein [Flavobacterium caeni]
MQKFIRTALLCVFLHVGAFSSAQVTLLDQTLLTEASFNTFTPVSVTGTQGWYFNALYGALCSGYTGGQSYENEDWFVGPAVNLSQTDNVKLTFSHTRGNASVLQVGVAQGWYKVFATASYTGNPTTTTWVELTGFDQNVPAAWQYISSGALTIPEAAKSSQSRIAFRYQSSATQSATWEIKNVRIVGEPQSTNTAAGSFKITNWNTEWLGCTQFGPTDENLQLANVAEAMLAMNSDIYCLQEVSNNASSPTLSALLSLMGTAQWDGRIMPNSTDDCDQRQAIIFKKSRVQFVGSVQLSSGNAAQGNSYYYNWSSGRYPSVYNVNLVAGTTLVPLTLVNIHAKAEDGSAMAYTRRLGGSEGLKTILDGANYNTKNVVLVGDFNDYLIGTTSNTCNCSDSPFKNFIDDANDYDGITKNHFDVEVTWEDRPIIEHFVISNELFDHFVAGSVTQELAVSQSIPSFNWTTSNHLPVSATFQFAVLDTQGFDQTKDTWTVYPNPVRDVLRFEPDGTNAAAVYDLMGRKMSTSTANANAIEVSHLPAGVYLLRMGDRQAKFVKQ